MGTILSSLIMRDEYYFRAFPSLALAECLQLEIGQLCGQEGFIRIQTFGSSFLLPVSLHTMRLLRVVGWTGVLNLIIDI